MSKRILADDTAATTATKEINADALIISEFLPVVPPITGASFIASIMPIKPY